LEDLSVIEGPVAGVVETVLVSTVPHVTAVHEVAGVSPVFDLAVHTDLRGFDHEDHRAGVSGCNGAELGPLDAIPGQVADEDLGNSVVILSRHLAGIQADQAVVGLAIAIVVDGDLISVAGCVRMTSVAVDREGQMLLSRDIAALHTHVCDVNASIVCGFICQEIVLGIGDTPVEQHAFGLVGAVLVLEADLGGI